MLASFALESSNVEHDSQWLLSCDGTAAFSMALAPILPMAGQASVRADRGETDMTFIVRPAGAVLAPPPTWVRVLLGLVLTFAGIIVLGDVMVATIISTIIIGITAIVAGGFEIVHAFWTKGWGGFLWQIFLGILYLAFGFVLVTQPVSGAVVLTYVLGLILCVSGVLRIFLGVRHWREAGWIMLFSGALGVIAGLIILARWPMSGLWVLGLLLGIDLISHGIAWLTFAWRPETRAA
jgi:uncharacterized membrane protein HdeD (DUF308 family)